MKNQIHIKIRISLVKQPHLSMRVTYSTIETFLLMIHVSVRLNKHAYITLEDYFFDNFSATLFAH